MCSPKRISKKFEGTGYSGKSVYSKNIGSSDGKPSEAAEKVVHLEHRFLRSLSDRAPVHTPASVSDGVSTTCVPNSCAHYRFLGIRQTMASKNMEQQLEEQARLEAALTNAILGNKSAIMYGTISGARLNGTTSESERYLSTASYVQPKRNLATEASALKRFWIDQELQALQRNIGTFAPTVAADTTRSATCFAVPSCITQGSGVSTWRGPSTCVVPMKKSLALPNLTGGHTPERRNEHARTGRGAAMYLLDRSMLDRELTMKRCLAEQGTLSSAPGVEEQRHLLKRGKFS